jgi:hypothetical protein
VVVVDNLQAVDKYMDMVGLDYLILVDFVVVVDMNHMDNIPLFKYIFKN